MEHPRRDVVLEKKRRSRARSLDKVPKRGV